MRDGLLGRLKIGMMISKQGSLIIQQGHLVHFRQEQVTIVLEHLLHIKERIQATARYLHSKLTNPDIYVRVLDRDVIITI